MMSAQAQPSLLFVTHAGPHGGVQTHVLALAREAQAQGMSVHVVLIGSGGLASTLENVGISYTTTRAIFAPLVVWWQAKRATVVHAHGTYGTVASILVPARIPTVVTMHGWGALHPSCHKPFWKQQLTSWLIKRAITHATTLLFICEADARRASAILGTPIPHMVVIPNGIEPFQPLSRTEARTILQLPPETVLIGALARFSEQKRLDRCIDTLARLPTHIHGVLIGSGPQASALRAHAHALGVEDRLLIISPPHDRAELLTALDVFLLSSDYEGLPYTLLEAMLARVPIVARPIDGIPEVIRDDAGWFADTPDDAARTIMSLLSHPEDVARRTEIAHARVIRDYRASTSISQTLHLLRHLPPRV